MKTSLLMMLALYTLAAAGRVTAAVPADPNATPEARALLKTLYAQFGHKTLSGQMWTPWGIDEIETVKHLTGKEPAICGFDYIHEHENALQNERAIAWWRAGGIPTLMWHWGAPTHGEGYQQSKGTIDIDRCFEPGTPEYTAMWADLQRIADHLTVLRDAQVPVLWRPMHEFDGGWFWYGKGSPEQFQRLWRTMFTYFVHERGLHNLLWVLSHSYTIKPGWSPGRAYYDLAGADSYGTGIQQTLFQSVQAIYGEAVPVPYHECGTIPDPQASFENGVPWSWWMLWHTGHLTRHDKQALIDAYHHERIITLDEVPDMMAGLPSEIAGK